MTQSTDKIIENAAAYVRRLSPEGQAAARRAREQRTRRVKRILGHGSVSSASWLAGAGIVDYLGYITITPGVIAVNLIGLAGVWTWAILRSREKAAPPPVMATGPRYLAQVVEEAQNWFASIGGMPVNINIYKSFNDLKDATRALTTEAPEAALVQTLLCEDLRKLIDNYTSIPPSLQKKAQGKDLTPYEQLCEGIQVIKLEMDKLVLNLNKRETAALEQQNAYLNLKYGADKLDTKA